MSSREGAPPVKIEELLRNLGEEPLLREAESLGLSPRGKPARMKCPFPGCADKGKDRDRDAQLFASDHPRIFCFACNTRGDLVDLLQQARGWNTQEAVAHLTGIPVQPRTPQLRVVQPTGDDPDKLSPAEVRQLWDGFAHEDERGQKYLEGRALEEAVELGLVRFATEQTRDKSAASQGKRGYRIAVLLSDVVGNPRGVQLRRVGEPPAREPKIVSIKGSSTGRAFFGTPDHIEAEPIVAVAEGLADTLALAAWVRGRAGVAVVGAAGKSNLPKLAEELEAANIPLAGKVFVLFPQNDRPKNASRREFVRLGQLLTKLGARAVLAQTDAEFKDLAEWRQARPDVEWPPAELAKAILPEPGDESPREAQPVMAAGCAVPIPARVEAEFHAQDFTTLCALLDDPMSRESVAGPGEITWCEMTSTVKLGGREIGEVDLSAIRLGLESQHRSTDNKPLKFSEEDVAKALSLLSRRKTVHPVRDWLLGLTWDGHHRIEAELPQVLGHEPASFATILLRRWMVSAVARALKPGCKVDTVLVLVGGQGAGKSSFFGALAADWFTDSPVNVGDKDGKLVMRRAWIVEWAELDAMRRARDQEAIKAFLSARVDLFRKPYGRDVVEAPRHCVIVGTTNNSEFLHDTTGNRRFWPVEVRGGIDVEWVKANRDQLFAEAVALFNDGDQWWLTQEEDAYLAEQNQEHEAHDVWTEAISDWLQKNFLLAEVTAAQLLNEALGKDLDALNDFDSKRVASILKQLGWKSVRVRRGGEIRRAYARPA